VISRLIEGLGAVPDRTMYIGRDLVDFAVRWTVFLRII
jgi:hypothetical protein